MKKNILRVLIFFICIMMALPAAGAGAFAAVDDSVHFSRKGGFYGAAFDLTLSTDIAGGVIYYTLDGSVPTDKSSVYTSPIRISDKTGSTIEALAKIAQVQAENWGYSFTAPSSSGIQKGMVIRAVVALPGGGYGKVTTNTYLIKSNYKDYYEDIAVIAISSSFDDFFGSTGIYRSKTYERIMNVELFDGVDNSVFNQTAKVKLQGAFSTNLPQKALSVNLTTQDTDGEEVHYSLYGTDYMKKGDASKAIDTINRFRIYSGGNDNHIPGVGGGTMFADCFAQMVANGLIGASTTFRPCLLYVNGEFWGIYALREAYSKDYFYEHYGILEENLTFLELPAYSLNVPTVNIGIPADASLSDYSRRYFIDRYGVCDYFNYDGWGSSYLSSFTGSLGDLASYYEMYFYILEHDMSVNSYYNTFQTMFDIDSFIDVQLVEFYANNADWPGNNNRMWRTKVTVEGAVGRDGKWRHALHDLDWGFKNPYANNAAGQGENIIDLHMGRVPVSTDPGGNPGGLNARWATIYLRKLQENKDFQTRFIDRYMYLYNTNFNSEIVYEQVCSLFDSIEPYIADYCKRWNLNESSYRNAIDVSKNFALYRNGVLYNEIMNSFRADWNLGSLNSLTLKNYRDKDDVKVMFGNQNNICSPYKEGTVSLKYLNNEKITVSVNDSVKNFDYFLVKYGNNSEIIDDRSFELETFSGAVTVEIYYKSSGELPESGLTENKGGSDDLELNIKDSYLKGILIGGSVFLVTVGACVFILIKTFKKG